MYRIHTFSDSWKIITDLPALHFITWHIPKTLNRTKISMQFLDEQHPSHFSLCVFIQIFVCRGFASDGFLILASQPWE